MPESPAKKPDEQRRNRGRILRFTIASLSFVIALGLSVWMSNGVVQFSWSSRSILAQPKLEEGAYDLSRIFILNRVLLQLQENYVDSSRFNPRWMLASGINEIQEDVPEIVATFDTKLVEGPTEVELQVGDASHRFRFGDIESLWEMSIKYKEVLRFIQENLPDEVDRREIEYAAINGVLDTLDPHSVLLPPEVYKDMLEGNRGNFGGLGIVIRVEKGELKVIRPMGGETPAGKAGVLARDRIVQIGNQSTLNMDVSEAVELLRGEPGTDVAIWIMRDEEGWDAPREFILTRDEIKIPSVESADLGDQIAYVRLKGFQSNTYSDMVDQIDELEQEMGEIKGLVLDLRDNPGGLLDQAIKISDEFLTEGDIVTTVGSGRRFKKPYNAKKDGTQKFYPMIVLVNPGSASASEIVAGALKSHDRALIVGDTTFGKGSVQVLYELQDGSALKLTIAQYLTPGEVSIQSVGIVPDIKLVPIDARKPDKLDLFLRRWVRREATLESHLDHSSARDDETYAHLLKYVAFPTEEERAKARAEREAEAQREADAAAAGDESPATGDEAAGAEGDGAAAGAEPDSEPDDAVGQGDDEDEDAAAAEEEDEEEDDDPTDDPEVRVARALLLSTGRDYRRLKMLEQLSPIIAELQQDEDQTLTEQLALMDIDWSGGEQGDLDALSVRFSAEPSGAPLPAGEEITLTAAVTNTGDRAVRRIYGISDSTNNDFEDLEFVFGTIPPGATVERSLTRKIPRSELTRFDLVELSLFEDLAGEPFSTAEVGVGVKGRARPHFAFNYVVVDHLEGNGDGMLSPDEDITFRIFLENNGAGVAAEPVVYLKNLNGDDVFLEHARDELEALEPGERVHLDFTFDVRDIEGDAARFEIHAYDKALGQSVSHEIRVPVQLRPDDPEPRSGTVTLTRAEDLLSAPTAKASVLAELPSGVALEARAALDGYLRVSHGEMVGWIASDATTQGGAVAPRRLAFEALGSAPFITLDDSVMEFDQDTLEIRGSLKDDGTIRDIYVFVINEHDHVFNTRKVAYQAINASESAFTVPVPVAPGMNRVKVVARDDLEQEASRSVYIFRR